MRKLFRTLAGAQIGVAVAVAAGLTLVMVLAPLACQIARECLAWSGDLLAQLESGLRTWGTSQIGLL